MQCPLPKAFRRCKPSRSLGGSFCIPSCQWANCSSTTQNGRFPQKAEQKRANTHLDLRQEYPKGCPFSVVISSGQNIGSRLAIGKGPWFKAFNPLHCFMENGHETSSAWEPATCPFKSFICGDKWTSNSYSSAQVPHSAPKPLFVSQNWPFFACYSRNSFWIYCEESRGSFRGFACWRYLGTHAEPQKNVTKWKGLGWNLLQQAKCGRIRTHFEGLNHPNQKHLNVSQSRHQVCFLLVPI